MAEVLSSGTERPPPRRWRRRTSVLAAVLAAAGVAWLAGQAGGRAPQPPPLSVVVRPAPDPYPAGPLARAPVFRLDGDPGPGPAGHTLLVGGVEPAALDTGTGRLSRLRLPIETGDIAQLDRAGGTTTALLISTVRQRSRAVTVAAGKVAEIGPALDLVPLRGGSVLTEDCAGAGAVGPCALTARTPAGAVRWRRPVPAQVDLIRDTPYGLLVRTSERDAGVVRLEDARTGRPGPVLGRTSLVLGADDRQVAFLPDSCGARCAPTLADLATGASRSLPDNPGNPLVAAFSADGRRLAIAYTGLAPEDPNTTPQRDGYVLVVDVATPHRSWTVPGLTTGAFSAALPVWARDGRLLLAVPTDGHGGGRVAVWTPGAPRLTVLPPRLTGFYGSRGEAVLE